MEGIVVPKTINSGEAWPLGPTLLVNLALIAVFGAQHSAMARPGFKRALTRIVPAEAERSTYVLAASLALILLFWAWRPAPQLVWSIEAPAPAAALGALSWAGWGLVLISTFLISHFHLFGLSQGFARLLRLEGAGDPDFRTPSLYKVMRHPIYAGFLIAFWATPQMSLGHLLFAGAMTGYILIGIAFEERDLIAQFGERYLRYKDAVGMFWPRLRGRVRQDAV